jgi:hypothetical protein
MYKHAALSPAIQALQQMPTAEAAKQSFEQQLGEQAYSTFSVKFPDLVESIVTFKTLDSDPDAGTAFGAFILDVAGEAVYVPVVFADSVISPLEIMYVKSKDMFVPLSPEWIAETSRSADQALGEAAKLPDTVATDVDIRNLVVPPTTGRYSYASDGKFAMEAAWTTNVGRQITKLANEQFDPVLWEGFITQFSRMNGMTPGNALDQGQMGIEELAKLYKSHAKTWGTPAPAGGQVPGQQQQQPPQQAAPAPAQPAPAQPQAGVASNAMPPAQPPQMYPKTAMSIPAAQGGKGVFQAMAPTADSIAGTLLESGALGALLGGGTAAYEGDYRNLASRAAAGGVGGAAFGGAGKLMGHGLNARHPNITKGHADEIGQALGTIGGGISAGMPDEAPRDQFRYAADLTPMMKHAFAEPKARELKLIPYLQAAPNTVKTAFLHVLREHPMLMKFAAETYGAAALVGALRARPTAVKTAGRSEFSPGMRVIKENKGTKAFGKRSPLAFRGVQMRGYYYEDTKKPKNMAVLRQEYHDASDIREPGVYNLWKNDGTRVPAFALINPICIFEEDRDTYPKSQNGLTEVKRYAPGTFDTHPEPGSTASTSHPAKDVERSHKAERLLVMKDGRWLRTNEQVHGEQMTEGEMEGGKVYSALFTDKNGMPKAGNGFFVYKTGGHYYGTEPVRLSKVRTDADGVFTADACRAGDYDHCSKSIRIDPKSPISRVIRPRGEDIVVVPAAWRWVPLGAKFGYNDDPGILLSASAVIDLGMNMLGSTNVKVRNAADKSAAIKDLADTYDISGADAEAMLKIAEIEGECRALIVSKDKLRETAKLGSVVEQAFSEVLQGLGSAMENIQGQMQVLQQVQQRAQELAQDPNAMQSTDPGMAGAPTAEQPAPADPSMDPAAAQGGAPAPAAPPPGGDPAAAAAPPPAPPQGAPAPAPGMDPGAAPADPNAAPGAAPADPSMDPATAAGAVDPVTGQPMAPEPPPLPMMGSEGPSSMEIAQQINPEFLEQAAGMQDAGVFDVGALSELDRAAGTSGVPNPAPLTENSRDLAETVDDLGRTLLMLQLRQVDLQEQLSGDTYKELEQQVRNTFQGLGKLMLDLHQHSSALSHVQDSNAA